MQSSTSKPPSNKSLVAMPFNVSTKADNDCLERGVYMASTPRKPRMDSVLAMSGLNLWFQFNVTTMWAAAYTWWENKRTTTANRSVRNPGNTATNNNSTRYDNVKQAMPKRQIGAHGCMCTVDCTIDRQSSESVFDKLPTQQTTNSPSSLTCVKSDD